MAKRFVLLLALFLMVSAAARAEQTVYDVLNGLMGDREFTLTVSAEAEGSLADIAAKYGRADCSLRRENGGIRLSVVSEGGAYLNVCLTEDGVSFDTDLIENGTFQSSWEALLPEVSAGAGTISIRMTGPDHELITFSCKAEGSGPSECGVQVQIGFITGPGNVHTLWDSITSSDGEAGREFYFTFSEEEYALEGTGTAAAVTGGDGITVITRDETCTVTLNEEELGTVTFRSVLTIR